MKFNKLLLLFNLILLSFYCISQSEGISVDTLEKQINSKEGIERVDMLINLSKDYLNQQPQRTIELANEALEISISIKDIKRQASAMFCIADGYRVTGDNIKALDYFLQSLKTFVNISDKNETED